MNKYPKPSKVLFIGAFSLALSSASLFAQTSSFVENNGDWALGANWDPVGVPDGSVTSVTAVVTNGRTANISSSISERPSIIRIGNNANGGFLNITAGSIEANNLQIASANASNGTVNLSGGTLTLTNVFQVASNTATAAEGNLNLSGGTLNWGTGLTVGLSGTGNLSVTGDSGSYSGAVLNAAGGSTFTFVLGADGVSSLNGTGNLTISAGASIVVDASAYTGTTPFTLISWGGTRSGSFDNVTITGISGSLVYDDTLKNLYVIPEPSQTAAVLSLGVFALAFCRRSRSR
jgi:hypothetical protein